MNLTTSELKKAENYILEEIIKCKDMLYYIENYIHIYDVDKSDFIKFTLWDEQKKAILDFDKNRLNIALKSRQIGMTWLVIGYSNYKMMFTPGYKVLAISASESHGFEMIDRMEIMLKNLPKWFIRGYKERVKGMPYWDSTKAEVVVHFPDGQESRFKTVPCSGKAAKSFTVNLLIFDEWSEHMEADKVWKAAYPTINRPTGGKFIGVSTMDFGTLYQDIWEAAYSGQNNFNTVFIPWSANPDRTEEWYEQTKRDNPDTYMHDYPATPEEAVFKGDDVAFPEFTREKHVCETFEPPSHWRRFIACDNGYSDPFYWLFMAIDEDGIVYAYKEYTREKKSPKITRVAQAENVVAMAGGAEIDYCVLGVDAWNTNERDPGKNILDYYREGGLGTELPVGFIQAVRDRKARKSTLHEYLANGKLRIMDCCPAMIRHIPLLMKDPRDPEKVGDSDVDHSYDALTYGLISHYSPTSRQKKKETYLQKHKRLAFKRIRR